LDQSTPAIDALKHSTSSISPHLFTIPTSSSQSHKRSREERASDTTAKNSSDISESNAMPPNSKQSRRRTPTSSTSSSINNNTVSSASHATERDNYDNYSDDDCNDSNDDDDGPTYDDDTIRHYIPPYLRAYVLPYHGDFCYTTHFHPVLLAQLMAEGFLPIASDRLVLPKLHQRRCVIPLPDALHTRKSTRKQCRNFTLTVNQDLHAVLRGCQRQHGSNCWLVPPLVQAFRVLHEAPIQATLCPSTTTTTVTRSSMTRSSNNNNDDTSRTNSSLRGHHHSNNDNNVPATIPVRLYSIEVWDNQQQLVAGELGYTVGTIYTSLTGFTSVPSAGSVQMAALGHLLIQSGFTLWDLGMDMPYKQALGATLWSRADFVRYVHRVRQPPYPRPPSIDTNHALLVSQQPPTLPILLLDQARNCKDIVDQCAAILNASNNNSAAPSTNTTKPCTSNTLSPATHENDTKENREYHHMHR
jgi:Leu/Phe-tRNA-protein transferase